MKTIFRLIIGVTIYHSWSYVPGATGKELEFIKSRTEKNVKSDIKESILKKFDFIKSIS